EQSHRNINITLKTFENEKETVSVYIFRVDRDRLSLYLPLSRFIVNLIAVYSQSSGRSLLTLASQADFGVEFDRVYVDMYFDQFMKLASLLSQARAQLWSQQSNKNLTDFIETYESMDWYLKWRSDDIGGLYQALEWFSPSHFISRLLYFYQLHDWFVSTPVLAVTPQSVMEAELVDKFESGWMQWNSTDRTLLMVEELFSCLIQLVTEPTFRVWRSIQNDDNDKWIEYDLIHWLALDSSDYRELHKKLCASQQHIDDTAALKRVADYEPPQQTKGAKYYLKSELWPRVNPYFHKYKVDVRRKIINLKRNKGLSLQLTFEHCDANRIALLGTSWMAIMWTCILHHVFVNDIKRFTQSIFIQCLQLIDLAVQ
ncbi:hypothetical protein RFI_09267, partial [Reticulomyxa filosa]